MTEWVFESDMDETEKTKHPESHILGGYLNAYNFKDACKIMWDKLTKEEKDIIKNIPNFNPSKFELITGIKV